MMEWTLNKKLHSYYFIFRWILFILISYILYTYPETIIIQLDRNFYIYFILASFIYLFLAQIVYIFCRNRKQLLSFIVKTMNIVDLIFLLTLITMTNSWSSIFVPLLFIYVFYTVLTFSRSGRWFWFLLTVTTFTGTEFIYNEPNLENISIWSVQIIALLFIFLMTSYVIKENQDELNIQGMLTKKHLIDPITGLYTHRSFQNTLTKFSNMDKPFSLIVADIDQFKQINEKYGYDVGDLLLSTYGHTLLYFQKEQNYFSFKYGVDQFFIILFETKKHHVQNYIYLWENLFEDSLKQIEPLKTDDVSMSYGVILDTSKEDKENLINRALTALNEGRIRDEKIHFEHKIRQE